MKIIRNSAKCTACGAEIESTHGHDFKVHFCEVEPTPDKKWVLNNNGTEELVPNGKFTWRFGVDGGKEYLRRVGSGWTDTSEYKDE